MSELAGFVLSAFRQVGGIVEPPAYGIYEVLLPEEVARRWNVPAYRRLTFADESLAEVSDAEDVTIVGYGHSLVEMLMENVRAEPACTQAYVNDLRLDKRELLALARQTLAFPNARLTKAERKGESAALCHYVRFNFKAALITDEKRERLVAVVMDAQAGFAVPELAHIEQLARLEEESAFGYLLPASVRWLPGNQVLSRPVLEGLLERATRAAREELAAPLETLRRRAARYLELDRARLTGYYDDIARDLQRRIERASSDARRASLEDKLVAAQAEQEAKLADVEAKYRLRVELELINLQVIVQPKILLPVRIGNRTARVERTVVWDPLLHRIEPLACDVCGRPATRLTLCTAGHLAHEDCLLPQQCVDCKRVYCQLCADQIVTCVVCERPVCVHSLNRCQTCGRGTCHEHVGLCHAADGQPARLPAPEPPSPPVEEKAPPPPPQVKPKPKPAPRPRPARPAVRKLSRPTVKKPRTVTGYRIKVQVEPDAPVVTAFVLTKGWKEIAIRTWELVEDGIAVTCRCEKGWECPANDELLEPEHASNIEAQLEAEIETLRQEYRVSSRRVSLDAVVRGAVRSMPRLVLRGQWKDDEVLAAARAGFAKA